ncbi:MAG: ferritin family protein [Planctomycetes bacterium]|nr:ferritin family protein [Planctomycetota bacterium]MBU2595991.1 ferritin family protein [Planctomycetota bacterium]
MGNLDSVEDVLRFAIGREVEANVFYNLLSQYTDIPQIRSLCIEFASEELEHKARLELELMKLGSVTRPYMAQKLSCPKPLDYMVDMAKVMQMDYEGILLLAMQKEKISFRLYIDLLSTTTEPTLRETLIELAEEEARHKTRFELEYDLLMAGRGKTIE